MTSAADYCRAVAPFNVSDYADDASLFYVWRRTGMTQTIVASDIPDAKAARRIADELNRLSPATIAAIFGGAA